MLLIHNVVNTQQYITLLIYNMLSMRNIVSRIRNICALPKKEAAPYQKVLRHPL